MVNSLLEFHKLMRKKDRMAGFMDFGLTSHGSSISFLSEKILGGPTRNLD